MGSQSSEIKFPYDGFIPPDWDGHFVPILTSNIVLKGIVKVGGKNREYMIY